MVLRDGSGVRTVSTRTDPSFDRLAELRLSARCRHSAGSGMPRPADGVIGCQVRVDLREAAAAVSALILDLKTPYSALSLTLGQLVCALVIVPSRSLLNISSAFWLLLR